MVNVTLDNPVSVEPARASQCQGQAGSSSLLGDGVLKLGHDAIRHLKEVHVFYLLQVSF